MQKKDENIIEIKPKPTTKIYYRVTVPDSGTLEAGGVVIKLDGIVARQADAQCQDKKGKSWPCGAAAKAALRRLVRARAVVCALPETGEQKSFTTRCAVSGTDLSTWMVRQGWAKPNDPPEPALADAARAAKSERIGLWRGLRVALGVCAVVKTCEGHPDVGGQVGNRAESWCHLRQQTLQHRRISVAL